MKLKAIVAAVAALVVSNAAQAADLGTKKPGVVAPIMTQFSWTGFYVGGHAGVLQNNSRWTDPLGAFVPFSTDGTGFLGGVQIGYRHQIGQIVLGVEADGSFLSLEGKGQCAAAVGSTCRTRADWAGSVRGRVGYAFDRFHVYATGGLAFANFKFDQTAVGVQSWGTHMRTGWTVGAGAEYALTNNWVLGAEYRYSDYGKKTHSGGLGPVSVGFKETSHQGTLRASYKF